jgi:hypothetical protein
MDTITDEQVLEWLKEKVVAEAKNCREQGFHVPSMTQYDVDRAASNLLEDIDQHLVAKAIEDALGIDMNNPDY